ncbi:hypothetical protein [Streptomyces sp. NPDC048639]|uniref:hypothetical protein n=1 Tax=Streptomyces sp. NPDC048639 TaxID=3365581 RepID=UPI003718740B
MPEVPDYFERLLARHAPAPGTPPRTAGRVRPRLAGPFERVEALRAEPPGPDEPAPLVPAAPRPAVAAAESVRHEREIRTDHHTVVRIEAAPHGETRRPAPAGPRKQLPRPAAQAGPVTRPAATDGLRRGRRVATPGALDAASPTAAPAPPIPGPGAALPAAAAAARPRPDAAATARGAARTAAARRGSRPVEQVVHVQIGRLEVSAAGASGGGRAAAPGVNRAGRAAPALSLEDFLSRGEKRG